MAFVGCRAWSTLHTRADTLRYGFILNPPTNSGFAKTIPLIKTLSEATLMIIIASVVKLMSPPALFQHLQERGVSVYILGCNSDTTLARCKVSLKVVSHFTASCITQKVSIFLFFCYTSSLTNTELN